MALRLLAAAALAAAAHAVTYKPLEHTTCAFSPGVNWAARVPRVDYAARTRVPVDLGALDVFSCTDANSTCTLDTGALLSPVMDQLTGGGSVSPSALYSTLQALPPSHPIVYLQGLSTFAVANVVLAILAPLIAALCICGRYCCNCFCRQRPNSCLCFRCGAPYPTRPTCCGCFCGFSRLRKLPPKDGHGLPGATSKGKDGGGGDLNSTRTGRIFVDEGDDDSNPASYEWGYPRTARMCAFLAVGTWVAVGAGLIGSAHFQGSHALTKGLLALGSDDDGAGLGHSVMSLVQGTLGPFQDALIGLSSDVVVPLVEGINGTVIGGLQLPRLQAGVACIDGALVPSALPNLTVASLLLSSLSASVVGLQGDLAGIRAGVVGLQGVQDATVAASQDVKTALLAVNTSMADVSTALDTVDTRLGDLSSFRTAALADLTSIKNDITGVQGNYPASAAWTAVAGASAVASLGPAGDENLNNLLMGALEGDAAGTNTLSTKAGALATSFATVPDTAGTAATMLSLGADVAAAQDPVTGSIALLITSLDDLQATVAALPTSGNVSVPLLHTLDVARGAYGAVAVIRAAIVSVDGRLAGLPSVSPVLAELDKVQPLLSAILASCLPHLQAVVSSVNTTLYALPSPADMPMLQYVTNATYANVTVQGMLGMLTDVRAQLSDAQGMASGAFNVSHYLALVDDGNATVAGEIEGLNTSTILGQLAALDSGAGGVNLTSVYATLAGLNASLSSARVNNTYVDELGAFSSLRSAILGNLTTEQADYSRLAKGYCPSGGDAACTGAGDCPGGCANIAKRRCWLSPGGAEQATVCTEDADCATAGLPAGTRCLGAQTRAMTLKLMLHGARDNPPALADALVSVNSALTSAQSNDPATSRGPLDSARSSVAGTDVGRYVGMVDDLAAQVNGGGFDPATVLSAIDDANTTLQGIDISSYQQLVSDGKSTLDGYVGRPDGSIPQALRLASDTLGRIISFTETGGQLQGHLTALDRPALAAAKDTGGPPALLKALASAADGLLASLQDILDPVLTASIPNLPLPSLSLSLPNVTSAVQPYMTYADRAGGKGEWASTRGHGPLHALLASALPDMVVASDDVTAHTVLADKAGRAYPNGRMCVTGACLRATAEAVSTAPLSGLPSAFPGVSGLGMLSSLPVPITREHILLAPWLFPAIAVLFGAWGLLAPLICCCRDPRWQKCPTGCMVGWSLCQLPCLLLLTAPLFPLMLGVADVCATGPNLAYRFVVESGDGLCSALPGASGTAAACGASLSTNLTLPGVPDPLAFRLAATVDLPATTEALLGVCPAPGSAADPFWPIFASAADSARTLPYTAVSSVLASSTIPTGVRPGLRSILLTAGNNTGGVASSLILGLGTSSLTCGNVKGLLDEVRSLMCCTLVGPTAWYVGTWFVMAWALLLIAVPAGCCGRKRLPTHPWGPAYEQARGQDVPYACCCSCCPGNRVSAEQRAREKEATEAARRRAKDKREEKASSKGSSGGKGKKVAKGSAEDHADLQGALAVSVPSPTHATAPAVSATGQQGQPLGKTKSGFGTMWRQPAQAGATKGAPAAKLLSGGRMDDDGNPTVVSEEAGQGQAASILAPAAAAGTKGMGKKKGSKAATTADLPPGWGQYQAEDGQVYYHNRDSGETSWERPLGMVGSMASMGEAAAAAAVAAGGGTSPRSTSARSPRAAAGKGERFAAPAVATAGDGSASAGLVTPATPLATGGGSKAVPTGAGRPSVGVVGRGRPTYDGSAAVDGHDFRLRPSIGSIAQTPAGMKPAPTTGVAPITSVARAEVVAIAPSTATPLPQAQAVPFPTTQAVAYAGLAPEGDLNFRSYGAASAGLRSVGVGVPVSGGGGRYPVLTSTVPGTVPSVGSGQTSQAGQHGNRRGSEGAFQYTNPHGHGQGK